MKKFAALLIIALVAIVLLVIFTNGCLGQSMAVCAGFIGYVVVLVENGFKKIAGLFPVPRTPNLLSLSQPKVKTNKNQLS